MNTLPESMTVTIGAETAVYVRQARDRPAADRAGGQMIHYSQRDPLWRDYEYAPGFTLGRYGCLIDSIAMVGSLYYGEDITPLIVAQVLRDAHAFDGGMLMRPNVISKVWPRLTYEGKTNWHSIGADLDELAHELEHYGATVIQLKWHVGDRGNISDNSHFVVLTGLERSGAQIVDSFDGEAKELLDSRYAQVGWNVAMAVHGIRRYRADADQKGGNDA